MTIFQEMTEIIQSLESTIGQMDWQNDSIYALWLSQQRYIVQKSVPYLGLCVFHSDQVPDFQNRCREHIREESGHERLLDNDLKMLGRPLMQELPETMLVYQAQFYQISMGGPLNFLGYVFLLEMLAPAFGPAVISKRKGKAVQFLQVHAHDDDDHLQSAQQILERLSPDSQGKVFKNFMMTAISYKAMLNKIIESSKQQTLAA